MLQVDQRAEVLVEKLEGRESRIKGFEEFPELSSPCCRRGYKGAHIYMHACVYIYICMYVLTRKVTIISQRLAWESSFVPIMRYQGLYWALSSEQYCGPLLPLFMEIPSGSSIIQHLGRRPFSGPGLQVSFRDCPAAA